MPRKIRTATDRRALNCMAGSAEEKTPEPRPNRHPIPHITASGRAISSRPA